MILAVDVGNTVTAVGGFSDRILFTERLSTDKSATEFEYAMKFRNICELYGYSPDGIEGAVISSVVPKVTDAVRRGIKKLGDISIKTVGPGIKTGLSIKIDDPAQLGSDLVTEAVAAVSEYSCPAVVIDSGTAMSISVIDKGRSYIGGVLMPGIQLSAEALRKNASQLPQISFEAPRQVICSNTIDCLKSGAVYGMASALDGLIERISEELCAEPSVIINGFAAETIAKHSKYDMIYDHDLLMKGLMIIYDKNK